MLEVVSPGALTTVQDGGRVGFGHLGVPVSGACDPVSLAIANLLVGNPPAAAALELTLAGPELRVLESIVVGLGGADLGATVGGRRLAPGAAHALRAGETVAFGGPSAAGPGLRAYLALPGGIDAPVVLGSRSTCLVAGFGGLDGRPLRAGDVVRPARRGAAMPERRWPRPDVAGATGDAAGHPVVRLLPGPADPDGGRLAELSAASWTVGAASARMGIRLEGAPIQAPGAGTVLTHGVAWGAVQLPPDGQPIVLLADAQPTGGYPVVAVAIAADRPVLGQLRPGDAVRFRATTPDAARHALAAQRAELEAAARVLAEDATWDALWHDAGA